MMHWRLRCAISTCVCLLSIGNVHAAEPIGADQARELSQAAAKVRLQRAMTRALLHECGEHYPRLQSAAEQATSHWLQANKIVLSTADSLTLTLVQSIKQQQSAFAAEKFALDIDQAIKQSVKQLEQRLAAYPPQQQHAVCNHLILSVNAGEWDVQHKQPKAYAILENYQ